MIGRSLRLSVVISLWPSNLWLFAVAYCRAGSLRNGEDVGVVQGRRRIFAEGTVEEVFGGNQGPKAYCKLWSSILLV